MRGGGPRSVLVAMMLTCCLIAAGSATIGCRERSISAADASAMRQAVDGYWAAKQHQWPAAERGRRTLSEQAKAAMRRSRKDAAARWTAGELKAWEDRFDPAAFLEELRASGTVVAASGYEIVQTGEPALGDRGEAQLLVTVWSWSEHYDCDEDGTPKGEPYKVDSTTEYLYTFERVGGSWKIVNERALSNPLDPDPETFGPTIE